MVVVFKRFARFPRRASSVRPNRRGSPVSAQHLENHPEWSGRLAFILASAGSAVGLGNIWKFPYIMGENGGGAFVIVYLICIAVIGVPVLIAETMIGRRGGQSPVATM